MSERRVTQLIEQAFDYRGYVTVSRRDGARLVGFIYDRGPAHVEMFDDKAANRIRVAVDEITDVELTGEDLAAKAQQIWERRKGALEPRETPAWGAWEEDGARPALFLVALPLELRGVAHVLGTRPRGAIVRGRLGDRSAVGISIGVGGGAARAIATERPRVVISCGFSGALAPSLATGDLVLASSVRDETGEVIAVAEPELRAARQALRSGGEVRVVEGEILCVSRVAATSAEKAALARPGTLAVDLESWSAARAAAQAGLPWLSVRVVLDPLEVDLLPFSREARASYLAPALRHALRGPRSMVELLRVGLRARTASRALAHALRCLGPVISSLGGVEPEP